MFPHPLQGGLNNMVSNVAQLVRDVCYDATETLVLPRFTTGANFFIYRPHGDRFDNSSHAFGDIFDVDHFARHVGRITGGSQCKVVEHLPEGATYRKLSVHAVGKSKPQANVHGNHTMLPKPMPAVHSALKPGRIVAKPLANSIRTIEGRLGANWAAVHLRIETDWMFLANYCRKQLRPRRCFTPTEIAIITNRSRVDALSSGTLLLYAEDLMNKRSPKVHWSEFGSRTTKLPLNKTLTYTVRAALEMFAAAQAPAGFYGNSYSTFSGGVAAIRSATNCADCRSYCYDCGRLFKKGNSIAYPTIQLPPPNESKTDLRVVDPDGCLHPLRVDGDVGSLEICGRGC